MLYELPELPPVVRTLRNDESDRLNRLRPDLPRSPDQCSICHGTGTFKWFGWYTRDPALMYSTVDYACRCDDHWILQRWLTFRGIQGLHQKMDWPDLFGLTAESYAASNEYVKNWPRYRSYGMGFFLHGDHGAGKSSVAAVMLKSIMATHGADGFFTTFAEIIDMVHEGYRDQEHKDWFQARVRSAEVLVLDDIGREHQQSQYRSNAELRAIATATARSMIDDLLRFRTHAMKPTFITSNFSLDEIGQKYGDNILSLMHEGMQQCFFTTPEGDYRKKTQDLRRANIELGLIQPFMMSVVS